MTTKTKKTGSAKKASSKKTAKATSNAKPAKKANAKAERTEKRLSALDAAAKVLGESSEPLTTKQMVEAMSAKGYWTSPGGKTPHATLYSAIAREINANGKDARFKKTERGKFAAQG